MTRLRYYFSLYHFLLALFFLLSLLWFSVFLLPSPAGADVLKEKRDYFQQKIQSREAEGTTRGRDFSRALKERRELFSNQIRRRWREFSLRAGVRNPYRRRAKPAVISPLPAPKEDGAGLPSAVPSPVLPEAKTRPPFRPDKTTDTIRIMLWGQEARLSVSPKLRLLAIKRGDLTADDIRGWWDRSADDLPALIRQAERLKIYWRLNDWGYLLLWDKIAGVLFSSRQNVRSLFLWKAVRGAGLDVRLALHHSRPYLLVAARQDIFETPRLVLGGRSYYLAPFYTRTFTPGAKFQTYPRDGRETRLRPIDLKIQHPPAFADGSGSERRSLRFRFGGRDVVIVIPANPAMLDYMDDFPLADFSVFVDAPLSPLVAKALSDQLLPYVRALERRSKAEAVNFLLRFVQTAFTYQSDKDRVGKEDYLFGEETLYAARSDCEDRVALFIWLARYLLDLGVVAVYWPGHLAAAVDLGDERPHNEGSILYRGRRYIYADPTFINADIGRVVPPYERRKPERIIAPTTIRMSNFVQ